LQENLKILTLNPLHYTHMYNRLFTIIAFVLAIIIPDFFFLVSCAPWSWRLLSLTEQCVCRHGLNTVLLIANTC